MARDLFDDVDDSIMPVEDDGIADADWDDFMTSLTEDVELSSKRRAEQQMDFGWNQH